MEAAGVLSSAFGLGMLLHASQAAFFSAINGHVKTLFLHRRRLVLLAFQLCISLYSIFQFASLLLLTDLPCQIVVRFTLLFDQCARIAILGLGVWKVVDESAFRTEKFAWVVVLALRVFLGGVVVSFTQNNFIPVCFPEQTQMFVGYIAIGFDIALWILLLLRIVGLWGLFADQGRGGRSEGKSQGYGMFLIALSALGWSVGSFPYLLKVGESIFVRMIPYILTLGLVLGVLALFPSIVFSVPLKSSDGFYCSRMQRLGSGGGNLQRAGTSSSPAFKQSPPRAGDIESNKHTAGFHARDKERAARDSNVFGGIIGAPIVHPGTALPWSSDNMADRSSGRGILGASPGGPIGATSVALQENSRRKSLVETLFPAHAGGRVGISGPILRDGGFAEPSDGISNPGPIPATTSPFPKVRTVSLRAAKEAERQRIDAQFERDQKKLHEAAATAGNNTTPTTSKSIPITPKSGGGVERTTSVKRKPVFPNDIPRLPSGPAPRVSAVVGKRGPQRNKETEIGREIEPESPSTLRESVLAVAEDANWGAMRYSTNTFVTDDDDTTRYTAFSNSPHPLRAPPREAGPRKADRSTDGEAKVLFINEIVYDHPALVNSLVRGPDAQEGKKDIGLTTSRYSGTSSGATTRRSPSSTKRPQLPTTQEVDEIPPVPRGSALVMDRPRHIRKDSGRGIFPPARDSEIALGMKLKKSVNTSKSLPPPPPPTEPLPPLPVQTEELPAPAAAPAEIPAGKRAEKKPTELIFPIPPSRAPSTRKPAPPPISIEPPGLVSPEVVRRVLSPLLTEPKPRPQEERLSVAPNVPGRSESRTSIISPFLKDGIDSTTPSDAAYETAKAWIASVASVRMSTGAPVLVNVEGGHRVSYLQNSDLTTKPLPTFTCNEDVSGFGSSGVSNSASGMAPRKSVLSFTVSPKVTRGDGDVTDVEIDSDSETEDEDEEDNYEGGRDSSGDTEMTQSEAGEMIGAGGEGYSTEDDEEDEDYLSESDSQEFSDHRDEVVISGMDDEPGFGKIEMTERKLNAKMDAIANAIPNMSAFPRHFNIGDHIPTFSESRGKYGSRRKPPPSPLGFLMCQRRVSRQSSNLQQDRIQARLTMLAENVSRNVAVLDDLLAKIPAEAKSDRDTQASLASDGRNSLIAKLEQEMGQQENRWHGMQEVLQRNSSTSVEDSRSSLRLSTNLARRRSLFEKLSSGIDRRLSTAQNSNTVSRNASRATSRTTSILSSSMTAGAWQRQLAEAQIEYLQHAPWESNNITTTNALVKPSAILKSQGTPVSVVSESEECGCGSVSNSEVGGYEGDGDEGGDIIVYGGLEIESPVLTDGEVRRKSFHNNDNPNPLTQREGEETVTISIETAAGSLAYGNDEGPEECEVEEYLETLPATVYSPSMQSEISVAYFSPSIEVASPVKEPAVSLLWNPQSISPEGVQEAEEISLWSKNRRSSSTQPLTRPAGIDVRSLQRVPLEPLTISSTELWKMWSTEPLSLRSDISIEIYLSPSVKELSPNPDQIVSFLWSQPEFVQEEPVDVSVASALWIKIPTIATPQTSGGLWRYQAGTSQPANRSPQTILNKTHSLRKTCRSTRHILAPTKRAKGPLWGKELADKPHPQLWARFSKVNGLWNGKGSTAILTEIDALLQNPNSLWTQHGKYAKPVFDDLSLDSVRPKRQPSTRPLEPVHGTLWIASISSVTSHGKSDSIRGLWNSRRGVDQETSEAPPPVTSAQEEELPASPIQAYKHDLLWQPGDRPARPAYSQIPPITSSKSTKRHDGSPLFLALPPATGSMWTTPTSKSNPCPPRLWTPSSVTLQGLWSFNNKTPSLATITRKSDPLWSKNNTPKPTFSTLTTESRRTFPARRDVTVSMAGPLWTSSPVEIQQPQLWKPLKKTDERLWTVEGTTPPLSQIANLRVEKTPLWSKENSTTAPIFSDLSLNSLRSKRGISTKNLPVVEEGLWTKRINLSQVPRATTGLWGTIEELPKVGAAPKRASMLWDKEGIIAPIFAHLSTDSARSKKVTSSIALPVFTEPMWKKDVVLRAKPELWKPTPKPTGLWDATAKTKTLAQMSFEKKAKSSPLWRKEGARRTTNAMPARTNTVARLPDKTALPKAVGGLWNPKIAVKPAPQLWARRKSMKVEKQPVGVLLWARETALRTTEVTPERTKVSFTPSDSPLPKVSGNLWQEKTPEGPRGLWKRPIKTVSSAVLQPSTPLWSREKASRRTGAVPEHLAHVPKKTFLVQADPPKASGALWKPKAQATPKGLWAKPAVITTKPIAVCTVLWTAASASRTTSAAPARSTVPKRVIEEPLPVVSGNMWQKKSPEKSTGLWKREIRTIGAFRKTSNAPLWSREGAARTTAAIPSRTPFVPKPASTKPLEPATGDLWQPELAEKEAIALWKQKPVAPKAGVWNAEGTTPSLAEIKWELAAKDTLWQRRSILAARGADEDIFSNRSSFIQKKLTMDPIHLDTARSDLWKPTESPADDDDTSWMITNTPPTGTLSHTSTLSDISEISPTSVVGAYEPRVGTHSKNSSISSTSGLWQPLSNCSSSKKVLWSNDETSVPFVNLIGDIRAEKTPSSAQREKRLETFDSSHNLWQPEILCGPKTIRSNSDASEYCTGGSVSEFSDDSFYSAMGAYSEHGGEENTPSNIFVGQFRRDNYIIHGQASEQKLAEDSPFASHLRIPSLRRKLRPAEERKGWNTDANEGQTPGAGTAEKVVVPSAGYLWSKGIV